MANGLLSNELSQLKLLEKFYQKMKLNLPEIKEKLGEIVRGAIIDTPP